MTPKKQAIMLKITRTFLLAGILFSIYGCGIAQKSWEEITSVEDLCESYPEMSEKYV